MLEKIWHLKHCDLFERLTRDQLGRLEKVSRIRKFERGSPIYLPSDSANGVLLLVSGRAKICNCTPDGREAILAFVEPGELFGELAIFEEGSTREESAEAVEVSTVVFIPADAIQRLIQEVPDFSVGVTKLIGLRRRRIERRLKSLLFRSNRERLTHLLLELADQYGQLDPSGIVIGIKLSHQELANIIGSTRETVTVTLGELQAEGFIRVGRKSIVLTNSDRLAASIGSPPPQVPAPKQSAMSI